MLYLFVLLLLILLFLYILVEILKTKKTWEDASKNIDEFFLNYPKLENIRLGCSFAPEEWNDDEIKSGEPLKALKIIVENLNIKDIRLGIRWNKVQPDKNTFDVNSFKSYLDYCISQNVNICLNIGPIKSFRWPEEHIPDDLNYKLKNSSFNLNTVHLDSDISNDVFSYLEKLLVWLKENYSKSELENIEIIQPENEGFNRMGVYKLKVSEKYFLEVIKLVHKYFPDKKILVNSAGRFNLKQIVKLFKKLVHSDLSFKHKLILGYDYYYKTEFRDKFFLTKILDSISISLPFNMSVKKLRSYAKAYCFNLEITEAQFEPWGKSKEPGNSLKDLQFIILRVVRNILKREEKEKQVVRLWGIEALVKRVMENNLSDEHESIISLIRRFNS